MDPWTSVLISFGGPTILLGIVAFLARSVIRAWLDKDVEKFKVELKSTSDTAIERLKADLQRAAYEHQVRFSKLHEKRAEVIAQLDKYLAETTWAIEDFVQPFEGEPSRKEKYVPTWNKIVECLRFLDQHRIYLPESLCNKLAKFLTDLRKLTIEVGVYESIEHPTNETLQKKWKILEQAWDSVKQEIPAARRALEQEFRQILGDDTTLKQQIHGSPTA
ncbi:MAG: hypothetical protein HY313_06645 [Acidobacteria bacterium]|nr:hypothetical protein [Acidobacteriota bacterium]